MLDNAQHAFTLPAQNDHPPYRIRAHNARAYNKRLARIVTSLEHLRHEIVQTQPDALPRKLSLRRSIRQVDPLNNADTETIAESFADWHLAIAEVLHLLSVQADHELSRFAKLALRHLRRERAVDFA